MVGSDEIFVSNPGSGTVSIIQPARLLTVPAGKGSEGFDVSPDGRQLWTANAGVDSVTVIDVATGKATETFPIPSRTRTG